ncbi:MAG: MBL fold metallo-hydrolase [Desulfobacter sp.]|nr:MAG: MBL fold metallo-hydrolase [Desulfobacter sp.]
MTRLIIAGVILLAFVFGSGLHADAAKTDIIPTSEGRLKITLVGHGSLIFEYGGKTIHVDPWTKMGDYNSLPKADLVLVTHHHRDHLDPAALDIIRKDNTIVVMTPKCARQMEVGNGPPPVLMANGDKKKLAGFSIEAIPAYNRVHKRDNGEPFHPKGEGNGYIITFGDKRIYVAGDTENTPEMKALKGIDAAFIPMNLPYTMDSEMAADAAKAFKPRLLYPYHTRSKEADQVPGFIKLMRGIEGVEIRDLN